MDHDGFYIFRSSYKRNALRVSTMGNEVDDDFLRQAFWGGELEKVVDFERHIGSVPYDFVFGGYVQINLISERVLDILEKYNITGWSTYDVRIAAHPAIKKELPRYYGLQILGRCNKIEYRYGPGYEPSHCFDPFDISSWDGSDLFSPEGSTWIFATQKVVDCFKETKITNVDISPFKDQMCKKYPDLSMKPPCGNMVNESL